MRELTRNPILAAFAAVALFAVAAPSPAQSADPDDFGADTPINLGEAVVKAVDRAEQAPDRSKGEAESLRVAVIPSPSEDADIRIRFSLPMASPSSLAKAPLPSVSLQPSLQGSWTWRSERELAFTPSKGALPYGKTVTVTVSKAFSLSGIALAFSVSRSFTVQSFLMGTKASLLPPLPGKPRLVAPLNGGTGFIGKAPVFLLFDQPVSAAAFAGIKAFAGLRALKATASAPVSLPFDADGEYDIRNVIALSVLDLPKDGAVVNLSVPTYDPEGKPKAASLALEVFTDFRWMDDGDYRRNDKGETILPLRCDVQIDFTGFADSEFLRRSLVIEPSPRERDLSAWSQGFTMSLSLDPGVAYRMRIKEGFRDLAGNALAEPFDMKIRAADLVPVLEIPAAPLVVETGFNRFPIKTRNLSGLTASIFRFNTAGGYVRALASGGRGAASPADLSQAMLVPIRIKTPEMNALSALDIGLDKEPGLKLVEVRGKALGSEGGGDMSETLLAQSTGMGIVAKVWEGRLFAWVVDFATAAPVPQAMVSLHDDSGAVIGKGTTDKDGCVSLPASLAGLAGPSSPLSVAAAKGKDISVLRITEDQLSGAWQFGLAAATEGGSPLEAALFTDRGAYRPGEEVHVKLFARQRDDGSGAGVSFTVRDPLGQEVLSKASPIDAFGGAAIDVPIEEGAAVGEYAIEAVRGLRSARATFRVEEYRVPAFKVDVEAVGPEWEIGGTAGARVSSAYYKGGKLDGRRAIWRVYRQFGDFRPAGFSEYSFFLDRDPALVGVFAEDGGTLNADSEYSIAFTPEHPAAAGPMKYVVEATVVDHDQQAVTGRASRTVHGADFYPGIRAPSKAVFKSGEKASAPVIVLDAEGRPAKGVKAEVYMEDLDFHTAAMMNEEGMTRTYNRVVTSSKNLGSFISAAGPTSFAFTVPDPGSHMLRISVTDRSGRTSSAGFPFTVTGDAPSSWARFDRERIDLVTDKETYKPGETATVVVQTPYREAVCLVTVEAAGVMERQIAVIKGDTPGIPVKIKGEYAPNAYVSVIVIRSRRHALKDASGFETGAPGFKIGYASIGVESESNRLSVALKPLSERFGPGQTAKATVTVKGQDGKPANSAVAVMVVDEGVLALTAHKTPDPVALAFVARALGVRNASNILDLPHAKRSRLEALFPGGDSDIAAVMQSDQETMRRLFKSTAYWNPSLETGADGTAEISFALPDNLTTFRIMAVAADGTGRMGSNDAKILVSKPLMVQPSLPRFAYPGDEFEFTVRAFNSTQAKASVSMEESFQGLELLGPPAAKTGSADAGGAATYKYRVRVKAPAEGKAPKPAILSFKAKMGVNADSVEVALPVLSPGNKETIVLSGPASAGLEMEIPANRVPGTMRLEAVISGTPLSELKDSVQYLMGYPNGCIEQTTSTAYPLIVLKDLLPAIGVEVNMADLKKFSEAGVERILSFQTPSGGLAYWPGSSEPHAFATAFGLTVLIEARKRGYGVNDKALAGMADYLEEALRTGKISKEMPHGSIPDGDTRALFVMTLGRLGRPQTAYINSLWGKKEALTPFGMSFLAIAVKESNGDKALLSSILAEIKKQATFKADQGYYEGDRGSGWSFDSPLRTHGGALIASSVSGMDAATSQKLLTGLLARREGGLWGNTQENVFGIMGVYQFATGGTGSISGSALKDVDITLNGKTYVDRELEKNSPQVYRLSLPEKSIPALPGPIRASSSKPGSVLTLRLSFDRPMTAEFMEPKSSSMSISRTYESLDGKPLDLKAVPLGSVVKVRLSVRNGKDIHYAAIDDKLPAGLEALNAALATTEGIDMGTLSAAAMRTLPSISFQEVRDHRVAFFADEFLAGDYEFVYLARATTAGTYLRPAAGAEAMYDPEVRATSEAGYVTVR
jgi:alpha-2-macroglobulin